MIEQHSAEQIGKYGYAHWSGKTVTPTEHDILLVPQSIGDGWEAYCSCGSWRCFIDFYEIKDKNALIATLRTKHKEHASAIRKGE